MNKKYQELSQRIFEQNKAVGWWDNFDHKDENTVFTKLMLTISEVAEAMEGDRKNLQDDHLPWRSMLEVELADAMIRVLDMVGAYRFDITPLLSSKIEQYLDEMVVGKPPTPVLLFAICCNVCDVTGRNEDRDNYITNIIAIIHATALYLELELEDAIHDKVAYNASRADHKRENRAQEGGKAY